MAFTEYERRVLAYIESYWMQFGSLKTASDLAEVFLNRTEREWSKWLQSVAVVEAFEIRGLPVIQSVGLSPEQLALANTLLDFADGRSWKKKFQDLGISTNKYQAWLKDANFIEYMKTRSENMLNDALPEAHLALIDNVRRGDLQSLKLYYEIQGRHVPNQASTIDVPELIGRILEILTKHIKDPVLLLEISSEFETLDKPGYSGSVPGEVVSSVEIRNKPNAVSAAELGI